MTGTIPPFAQYSDGWNVGVPGILTLIRNFHFILTFDAVFTTLNIIEVFLIDIPIFCQIR